MGTLTKTQQEGQNLRHFSLTAALQINHCFYKALLNSFQADHPAPPQPQSTLAQGRPDRISSREQPLRSTEQ